LNAGIAEALIRTPLARSFKWVVVLTACCTIGQPALSDVRFARNGVGQTMELSGLFRYDPACSGPVDVSGRIVKRIKSFCIGYAMQKLGWGERLGTDGWVGGLWRFQARLRLGSWTGPNVGWPGGTATRGSVRQGMATRVGVGDVTASPARTGLSGAPCPRLGRQRAGAGP